MMRPIPLALGPRIDDWDPQGYDEEESEDTLAPGMHFLNDDEDEEDEDAEEENDIEVTEDSDEDDISVGAKDLIRDPLEELDELENLVNQSDRETMRLSDFSEED